MVKPQDELEELRQEMDLINRKLAELLVARFSKLDKIAKVKFQRGHPPRDLERRRDMLAKMEKGVPLAMRPYLRPLFETCLDSSEDYVRRMMRSESDKQSTKA